MTSSLDEHPVDAAPGALDRTEAWCVVGAGAHGLSSFKALLQNGIDADCFEREGEVGGTWNFGAENSRVYRSTHLISSKPFTQFPDFPMPDHYPDYPSHVQALEYFRSYARHFGLAERIVLGHDVVSATAVDGGRHWLVVARDRATGAERVARYGGLVVANGHNWHPKIPRYPGQDDFAGRIMHSAQYRDAEVLRGRRVVVVGAGNTGCDVAVESAQNAEHTWHSTRRGYYYNPKYAMGRPSDQTADLLLALRLPLPVRRAMFRATLRLTVGDQTRFGMKKPDHRILESHPVINQQLVYYVGQGDITPCDDIERFEPDGVVFTDGRRVDVDLVVLCTGYLVRFPFLPQAEHDLNWQGDHPQLALAMFTPAHDNLVVSGLIQPDSGQWALAHWQGVAIARYAQTRRDRPSVASRVHAAAVAESDRRFTAGSRYLESTRHYYEIGHQAYLGAVEDFVRALESAR